MAETLALGSKVSRNVLAVSAPADFFVFSVLYYPELVRDVGKYLYEIDIKGTKKIMQSLLMDED